jgi:hypothetical protein
MYSSSTLGQAFTLDSGGFDLLGEVSPDTSTDFGEWAFYIPIEELNDNTWTVAVTGSTTVDGDNVSRVTLGTLDVTNGVVGEFTNGDIGEAAGYGYSTSRHIHQVSNDSEGNMHWYINTADDGYAAVYWTLPPG